MRTELRTFIPQSANDLIAVFGAIRLLKLPIDKKCADRYQLFSPSWWG